MLPERETGLMKIKDHCILHPGGAICGKARPLPRQWVFFHGEENRLLTVAGF
jgi:hypothetical protein